MEKFRPQCRHGYDYAIVTRFGIVVEQGEGRTGEPADFMGKEFEEYRPKGMAARPRAELTAVEKVKLVSIVQHTFTKKHTKDPVEVRFKEMDSTEFVE